VSDRSCAREHKTEREKKTKKKKKRFKITTGTQQKKKKKKKLILMFFNSQFAEEHDRKEAREITGDFRHRVVERVEHVLLAQHIALVHPLARNGGGLGRQRRHNRRRAQHRERRSCPHRPLMLCDPIGDFAQHGGNIPRDHTAWQMGHLEAQHISAGEGGKKKKIEKIWSKKKR
jgi:hypothetical protein